jgi:hypothetical protein
MEKREILVLSTGHITKATAELLDGLPANQYPSTGGPYGDYGYFLYAYDADHEYDDTMPDDLKAVLTFARAHGCVNVLLDCDADTVDGLPVFDW